MFDYSIRATPHPCLAAESLLNHAVNSLNLGQCFSHLYRGCHNEEPEKRRVYWVLVDFYRHIVKADLFEAWSYFRQSELTMTENGSSELLHFQVTKKHRHKRRNTDFVRILPASPGKSAGGLYAHSIFKHSGFPVSDSSALNVILHGERILWH